MPHIVDCCIAFNNILLYVMLIIIIIVEVFSIRSWTGTLNDVLVENELSTLQLRAQAAADRTSVLFGNMASDLALVKNFTQHIVNDSIPSTGTYPTNYFNSPSYSATSTERALNSGWYNHASGNDETSLLNHNLNKTSLFRHPWSTVSSTWLAQGFGDANGLTRFFPLTSNNAFPTLEYRCVSNDPEKNNTFVNGFDPRCRQWYADAERSPNSIIYSSPYEDALSGGWVITLSAAILNATDSIYGILFSDVSMTSLQSFYSNLNGDHNFLIDENGDLIAHNVYENGASLQQRLFSGDTASQNNFVLNQLSKMQTNEAGSLEYTSRGSIYIGGFARVKGTKYITGLFIDKENVDSRSQKVENDAEGKIFIIAYLIAYFGLYSIGMGSICCGKRPDSPLEGVCKIGFPLSFLFISLLAIALPISLVSNASVVKDTENLLTAQSFETVQQLSINNGDWLNSYLQATWLRNIKPLFKANLHLSSMNAELQNGVSYLDDTNDASLLLQPLQTDPRLSNVSWQVSLGSSSYYVTGVTSTTAAAALSSTIQLEISNTQLTNQMYRSLYTTNPDFVLTYTATSNKLFRKYPGYTSSDSAYDPTARSWYTGATQTAESTSDDYYEGVYFSPAYKDAFSGEWMMTISRSLSGGNTVIAGDLLLATISTIFSNIKFFRTGKATLFDFQDNIVVADRNLLLTSARSTQYSYFDLQEPAVSDDLFTEIKNSDSVGPKAISSGGVDYYVYSRKLDGTALNRFGIMVSVPSSEAKEAAQPTIDKIKRASVAVGLGLGLSCLAVILFILGSSAFCR